MNPYELRRRREAMLKSLEGTPADTPLDRARLSGMTPGQQFNAATLIGAGIARTVAEAQRIAESYPDWPNKFR
ncbi:hypothetical protein [Rubrobacter aplysinae]|uniref:hypothetical protein n=1 Tax=Rubrobacter aplysinae TaxID=909625 RepID=UPI00064BDC78|nr:hypothetical protein [Rubrobacter aplysinae]